MGEFGLIKLLADIIDKNKNLNHASWQQLIVGIGDDTAAWQGDDSIQLATTDCLIQDTHFALNITPWEELGWKAVAVNLSDIAAMGGIPKYILVSLALPGEIEVDCVSSLYRGMTRIADQFEVAIAGGNVASSDKVMITITIIGISKDKTMLTRSAARPGDIIAITGYTGLSAAGLMMLKQEIKCDTEATRLFREAHLKPIPRIPEGQILLYCGATAAIDISDGLIADLSHICESSHVSARISSDLIPIHPTLQRYFKNDCLTLALTGGEDYELLFTANDKNMEYIKKSISCPVTIIGEIIREEPEHVIITGTNKQIPSWQQGGWNHFKSQI